MAGDTQGKKLCITLYKSQIGRPKNQHRILQSLGLRGKLGQSVILPDNASIRGMLSRVGHLVRVEPAQGE